MNKNVNKKVLYVLPLLLWSSCQAQSPPATQAPAEANPDRSAANSALQNNTTTTFQNNTRTYPALQKHPASGQIQLKANQLVLSLELYPETKETSENKTNHQANFQTQRLNLSTATKLQATVTDSHGKTYQPNGADGNGAINYSGGTITLTFDNLVPDELLLVEVQAKNGTTDIVQADLAAVLKHTTAASNPSSTINFQTTVAAKAMKALLANDAERARAIDLNALNAFTAAITGVTGTAPNFSYAQNHPSLVNTALLASHLQAQNPASLTAADYRQSGASVNLNVSGLQSSDKLQVQITDAASAVSTNLGNGNHSISGVTPGNGIQVLVSAFGTPGINYTYTVTPTTFNPAEGGNHNVTVTAEPVLNISGFSPAAGTAGTVLTVNGTGFNGTTAVSIGGASASFTVNNDYQMTVTVPTSAVDGQISITNTTTTQSATAFDVYRRIYVNHAAGGNNTGSSWANAYTNLQTALSAAGAQDEIWVAAGTYKPHASDRSIAFQMKDNVDLYGGFAGTEAATSERNLMANTTRLSGDLMGNDVYSGTTFSNMSENSFTVVKGADARLDGFTLSGGNSNGTYAELNPEYFGGGLFSATWNTTLENLVFEHNYAGRGGGAYLTAPDATKPSASVVGKNLHFRENHAVDGGAIKAEEYYDVPNNTAIDVTIELDTASFIGNRATTRGGAIETGSIRFKGSNIILANNVSDSSGGAIFSYIGRFELYNVTLANNQAASYGGILSGGTADVKNMLSWGNVTTDNGVPVSNVGETDPSKGNLVASSDPFIDSTDPDGPDNIIGTADDGLRIDANASAAINTGINDVGIPTTDILGNAREGNPEPGAYEYIAPPLPANVLVVKANATGNNDGSSWANAFTTLQGALAAADGVTKTEIWIAAGTYKPASQGDSFVLKNNVDVYGGFAGNEVLLSARNSATHPVILSGDLGNNDGGYPQVPFTTDADNVNTVVNASTNARLEGVTIQGGRVCGIAVGGSQILHDLIIKNNNADRTGNGGRGGGMTVYGGSPSLSNLHIAENYASQYGGGIMLENTAPSTLEKLVFKNNKAPQGAALDIQIVPQSFTLSQAIFVDNIATSSMNVYANIYNGSSTPVTLTFNNVLFANNVSQGEVARITGDGYGTFIANNVTVANNTVQSGGFALFNEFGSSPPTFIHNNFLTWQSTASTPDAGSGNIHMTEGSPFLNAADPDGADNIWFTADDGFNLASSLITAVNAGITGPGIPSPDIVGRNPNGAKDAGAYEYHP